MTKILLFFIITVAVILISSNISSALATSVQVSGGKLDALSNDEMAEIETKCNNIVHPTDSDLCLGMAHHAFAINANTKGNAIKVTVKESFPGELPLGPAYVVRGVGIEKATITVTKGSATCNENGIIDTMSSGYNAIFFNCIVQINLKTVTFATRPWQVI